MPLPRVSSGPRCCVDRLNPRPYSGCPQMGLSQATGNVANHDPRRFPSRAAPQVADNGATHRPGHSNHKPTRRRPHNRATTGPATPHPLRVRTPVTGQPLARSRTWSNPPVTHIERHSHRPQLLGRSLLVVFGGLATLTLWVQYITGRWVHRWGMVCACDSKETVGRSRSAFRTQQPSKRRHRRSRTPPSAPSWCGR